MNLNKSVVIESIGAEKNRPRSNDFAEFENMSDCEIWKNFSKGDSDGLLYIYHKYVSQLLKFGIQFAPREVVKDSIQDLFLYLKERKNQSTEVKNIAAYLYKSLYRIVKKKVDDSLKLSSLNPNLEVSNWKIAISKEIKFIEVEQQKEQSEKLQRSINDLSIKQRQALLLYYYDGFTHNEIADIMDLKNKSSVRKLIYRGLDTLKENMAL